MAAPNQLGFVPSPQRQPGWLHGDGEQGPGTPDRYPQSPLAPLAMAFWSRVGWAKPCGFTRCRWVSPIGTPVLVGGRCLPMTTGAWAGFSWEWEGFPSRIPLGERKRARTLPSDLGSALDTNGLQITIINYRRWDNLPTVMLYYHDCSLYINV